MIELGHCIALSSFDALRKYKKVFLLCTLLSGVEEREREGPRVGYNVVLPTLPTYMYMCIPEFRLQPGIDFYMEMPGLVEREAFFV